MDRADLVCITLLIHNTLIIQAFLPKALMPENQSKLFGLRITNDTQYSYRKRLQYGGTEGTCRSRLTPPNGVINRKYLKNWADVADKIGFGPS